MGSGLAIYIWNDPNRDGLKDMGEFTKGVNVGREEKWSKYSVPENSTNKTLR